MFHALYAQAQRQLLAGQLGLNRMGELMVEHTARLLDMQLEAAGAYARIGVDQLRALNTLGGPTGVGQYLQTQRQLLDATVGLWSRDLNRLSGLGQQFNQDMNSATEENVVSMADFLRRSSRDGG